MADVVALDDATSQRLQHRLEALQAERDRLAAPLRFAGRVQQQLNVDDEGRCGRRDESVRRAVGGKEDVGRCPGRSVSSVDLAAPACPICLRCHRPLVYSLNASTLSAAVAQRATAGASSFRCPPAERGYSHGQFRSFVSRRHWMSSRWIFQTG